MQQSRHSHLAESSPFWATVAEKHKEYDLLATKVYELPIEEFRKLEYKPPPIPKNAPVLERDIIVREKMVTVRDGTELVVRIYQPLKVSSGHLLFFNTHGGGWTVGSPQSEEGQNRFICHRNEAIVVSVNYRKAPEFPFPYALHDALDIFEWVQRPEIANELGIDTSRIIVGGGSAGANLAAVIAQIYRDEGKQGIIGQVLNIPVTCHPDHFPANKFEYGSYEQNANAPIVNSERMRKYWNYYLPSSQADKRTSPLLAESFKNLPPALIQVAGMDPLRDEGIAYAEALRAAGVKVDLKIYGGMPHAFYVYPELPPSVEYFKQTAEWVGRFRAAHQQQ